MICMELERIVNLFDRNLLVRALDIVEQQEIVNGLAERKDIPEWQLDKEVEKIETSFKREPKLIDIAEDIRNYPLVRSYAEFQRNSMYSNNHDVKSLAAAGMLGATAQNIVRNGEYDRRNFLKVASPAAAYLLLNACGGNGGNVISPTPDNYLDGIPVTVKGLQTGMPLNGTIKDVEGASIPFQNGVGTIVREHKLLPGRKRITIETNEGYARITGAMLTSQGFNIDNGDGRTLLLDAIELDNITGFSYDRYRGAGHLGPPGSYRFLIKPKFFVYETLHERVEGGLRRLDGRPIQPNMLSTIIDVVLNDVSHYTDGFITPELVRETQSSERPNYNEAGWIIYVPVINTFRDWAIEAGWGAHTQNGAALLNYNMFINAKINFSSRWGISSDTWQGFGYHDQALGWDGTDRITGRPTQESRYWGRIKYNRKVGHTSGAVPDLQN